MSERNRGSDAQEPRLLRADEGPASRQDTCSDELSVAEAASAFAVSQATLRRLISAGLLPARQVVGVRGREWRVSSNALEEAGYRRRAADEEGRLPEAAEIRRLTEALAAERARSSQLDNELGYAMLTIGRLRGRLSKAGIDPDGLFGADLFGAHLFGEDLSGRQDDQESS